MSKIRRIYISIDSIHLSPIVTKYFARKALVEFENSEPRYSKLSYNYDKLSLSEQQNQNQRLNNFILKYMINFSRQEEASIGVLKSRGDVTIVDQANIEINQYIDNIIYDKKLKVAAIHCHELSISQFLISFLELKLVASHSTSFFLSSASLINAFWTLYYSLKQGNREKENSFKLNSSFSMRSRLALSGIMIALNLGYMVTKIDIPLVLEEQKMLATIVTRPLTTRNIENPFETENLDYTTVLTQEESTNLLMESFKNNPYLSEDDLTVALQLQKYCEENPYIDYEKLYDNFGSVFISYSNNMAEDLLGTYSPQFNCIRISNTNILDQNETKLHELMHITGELYQFKVSDVSIDAKILNEGMTELLTCEYFYNGIPSTYFDYVTLTKIFCELVGADKMLEAYSKKEPNIIVQEVFEVSDNEEECLNLFLVLEEHSQLSYEERISYYEIQKLKDAFSPYLNGNNLTSQQKKYINYYLSNFDAGVLDVKPYFSHEYMNHFSYHQEAQQKLKEIEFKP